MVASPLNRPAFVKLGADAGVRIGDFFRFMVSGTPVGPAGSLSHREYVEILAFILSKNGYRPGRQPLTFQVALHSRIPISEQPRPALR